tara:strand:+ start:891 stop:1307 length:417 start_codon:yes stop_codon:yes gene_type:complete
MRKIHIYYIIFLINVINLFFRLYYKKFLQITTFYKIENMDQLNSMANKLLNLKEDTILDTGNLNFMLLIYCILSFLIGWKYSKLKYFLFLILFLFEGLNFYYMDNIRTLIILGSIIFYVIGSFFKKKKSNIQEHVIYK